jgi:hypothetical protein
MAQRGYALVEKDQAEEVRARMQPLLLNAPIRPADDGGKGRQGCDGLAPILDRRIYRLHAVSSWPDVSRSKHLVLELTNWRRHHLHDMETLLFQFLQELGQGGHGCAVDVVEQ